MAQHTILLEAFYSGDWHVVPTLNRQDVVVTGGQQDQLTKPSPAQLIIDVNNRDGIYSPENPMSALYGLIGRNTPVRLTVDGDFEFHGEVEAWPQRWDKSGQDFWVPITAYGVRQRLGMPGLARPAKSALFRTIMGLSAIEPFAYWALDDGPLSESGVLTSGDGTDFASLDWGDAIEPGNEDLASWLGPGVLLTGDTAIIATVPLSTVTRVTMDAVYRFSHVVDSASSQTAGFTLASVSTFATGSRWTAQLSYNSGSGANLLVGNPDVPSVTILATDDILGGPHHLRLDLIATGANVNYLAYLDGVEVIDVTVAASIANHPFVRMFNDGADGSTSVWTDFAVWVDETPPDVVDMALAATGYASEQAHERIERLCNEEGIAVTITGTESEILGAQPVATFPDLLEADPSSQGGSAPTDLGILYEPRDALGFVYRCRATLENQDPAATLTYGQKEVGSSLEPTPDLDFVRNDVTVTRIGGSSSRSVQETGPLNISSPVDDPQGVGRYPVELHLPLNEDAQAAHQASWRRWIGTWPGPRLPALRVDIDALLAQAKTALVAQLVALVPGDVLRIDDVPLWVSRDGFLDLLVMGYTRVASLTRRTLELNLAPYGPYRLGILADTSGDTDPLVGRLCGDDPCALRVAVDDNDLSFVFDPNAFRWTTVADDFNPDLRVRLGGEVVEVSTIATTPGTFVAAGAAAHAVNNNVSPGMPLGATAGDLLLVLAAIRNSGTGVPATPAGYTRLPIFAATDNVQVFAIVHGVESAPTITFTGGVANADTSAQMVAFRSMPITLDDLADVVLSSVSPQLNASAQNIAVPELPVTPYAGQIVLAFAWKQDDWTSVAPPTGFTEIGEPDTTTGDDQGITWAYRIDTTPAMVRDASFVVTGGAGAISRSAIAAIAAGHQTMTVSARSVNGVVKSHAIGARIEVADPLVLGL